MYRSEHPLPHLPLYRLTWRHARALTAITDIGVRGSATDAFNTEEYGVDLERNELKFGSWETKTVEKGLA